MNDLTREAWSILLERSTAGEPINPAWLILGIIPMLFVYGPLWRGLGLVTTIVHEAGHALVGLLFGSRIKGISINLDHSGHTESMSSRNFLIQAITTWVGYPAPGIVGALLIFSSVNGHGGIALTLLALASILLSLNVGNFLGMLTIWSTAAVVLVAWWSMPAATVSVLLYLLGCFLLVGGFRTVVNLINLHRSGDTDNSDASALFRETLIPAIVWLGTFLVAYAALFLFATRSVFTAISGQ